MIQAIANLLLIAALTIAMPAEPPTSEEEQANDWARRGVSLVKKQEFEGARGVFAEAIRIDKDCALAHLGRGVCQSALGEFDEAKKDLEKCIDTDTYCPLSADADKLRPDKEETLELAAEYGLKEQLGLDVKAIILGGELPAMIYARVGDVEILKGYGIKKLREKDLIALINLGESRWQVMHLAEKKKRDLYMVLQEDESWLWGDKKPRIKKGLLYD